MCMAIKIALAGNPNSGKTTLFNALTGSSQYVGNWPGVTVEKKEGRLKGNKDVVIQDLPGIYSLSPYTLEEVVSREYLVTEKPDAILNIIDGTNIERNLYLTTQLIELGIPVVMAVNMIDLVRKNGDKIDLHKLSQQLGCQAVEISALKGEGSDKAAQLAVAAARKGTSGELPHVFTGSVEHAIAHIEESIQGQVDARFLRWYAVKLFERDEKVQQELHLDKALLDHIETHIVDCEKEMDDDAESIITAERYAYIAQILKHCYHKKGAGQLSISDKIDRVVTNRILALPIFAVIMFCVYYLSVSTVGTWATDWANDGLFGEGFHLFGIGGSSYSEAADEFSYSDTLVTAFEEAAEAEGVDPATAETLTATAVFYDDEGNVEEEVPVDFTAYTEAATVEEPDPADYGVWIPGIPVLVESGLKAIHCAGWLQDLILNGIVAGVGAVLGFVPQMLVLFLLLAILESCGYMARIAFVLDRVFRKFGLSGKSFIPMLIGTGCGVPGVMASRTIESERDRRMTVMTTTFIPCSAKLPIIALISGALFGGAWWVAPSAYFVGIAAIIISGIMLKKTKMFAGEVAPFVMELPAYHLPTIGNVLRSMWERGWSFIKKAGTVILLATILVWFLSGYGFENGSFGAVADMDNSLLAAFGNAIAWIFIPLGWGNWQSAAACITGLIAKENVVGTFGVLLGHMDEVAENGWEIWAQMATIFTPLAGYSYLVFNLLCAPCFAAMGAIKREMNNWKWTLFAIGYQCVFAYAVALVIYQFGLLFTGSVNVIGLIVAIAIVAVIIYMLARPDPEKRVKAGGTLKARG